MRSRADGTNLRALGLSPRQLGTSPRQLRAAAKKASKSRFQHVRRDGRLPRKVRFAILKRDGFRCWYCGASGREVELHVDHVVARANGGGDDPANLRSACRDCNLGKGADALVAP